MIYLMREYNWTMLKIITQEEKIFIEVRNAAIGSQKLEKQKTKQALFN